MHGANSGAGSNAATQERLAALNMSSPIYTSADPEDVSSTPKTLLMNVVQSIKELTQSRLRRMMLQLLQKENGRVIVSLLAHNRNAIKFCTVVTRFEADHHHHDNTASYEENETATRLIFKTILDVKIYGEVSTVEIISPVSFVGKFDDNATLSSRGEAANGPLLSRVDIKFDCSAFLKEMIVQARMLVKMAGKQAAALCAKILSINTPDNASRNTTSNNYGGRNENSAARVALGESNNSWIPLKAEDAIQAAGTGKSSLGDQVKMLTTSNVGSQQGYNFSANDHAKFLAAALKMGVRQGSTSTTVGPAHASATQHGFTATSSLTQLASLLPSTSANMLNAIANPNLSSNLLNFEKSFDSVIGDSVIGDSVIGNNLGNFRNDTFSSLLNIGGNAERGLNHGGDSAAILRRHLQNVVKAPGTAGGNSNANATFDFENTASNGGAATGGSNSNGSLPSTAARISSRSIERMNDLIRFHNPPPNMASSPADANQPSENALKKKKLNELGNVLQNGATLPSNQPQQHPQYAHTSSQPATAPNPPSNIHKGLFSWLEQDSMFLSDDKLKEQDRIHSKNEKESQKAPMPLRFFSSVEEGNLKMMDHSLFGGKKRKNISQLREGELEKKTKGSKRKKKSQA